MKNKNISNKHISKNSKNKIWYRFIWFSVACDCIWLLRVQHMANNSVSHHSLSLSHLSSVWQMPNQTTHAIKGNERITPPNHFTCTSHFSWCLTNKSLRRNMNTHTKNGTCYENTRCHEANITYSSQHHNNNKRNEKREKNENAKKENLKKSQQFKCVSLFVCNFSGCDRCADITCRAEERKKNNWNCKIQRGDC